MMRLCFALVLAHACLRTQGAMMPAMMNKVGFCMPTNVAKRLYSCEKSIDLYIVLSRGLEITL